MRPQGIKWLPVLMAVTIAGIAAFQMYWLQKTYEREKRTLERSSNMTFRETVHQLQTARLKLEGLSLDSTAAQRLPLLQLKQRKLHRHAEGDKMANLMSVLTERLKDSAGRRFGPDERKGSDSMRLHRMRKRDRLLQFLYAVDSLQDSLQLPEIHAALQQRFRQQNIDVPFTISQLKTANETEPDYNEVTLGFLHPITYRLTLNHTTLYLFKRIAASILLSLFIVGLTTVSFLLLYRNLLRQRRLADIKNEFISNITHELKTPIATVSVAIEALRSFNATNDTEKSKEYLNISANELQRLSLLVDKVLKLSMFEKQAVELKYERLDLKELSAEVVSSMRLQAEKWGADVRIISEGNTMVQGDRLHLVSVIFNLLDNALKYSNGAPQIQLKLSASARAVTLSVADNGIGIPAEYRDKVFDKFFRVPTGNLHNAKGYGLGLSYAAHVVRKHQGTIQVKEGDGRGTCFVITLPKQAA